MTVSEDAQSELKSSLPAVHSAAADLQAAPADRQAVPVVVRQNAASRSRGIANVWVLALVLGIGLVHGLIYVFLMPPWQHYDEPTHFEYAWLIANRNTLPKVGDYDQDMRRAVAISMAENGFFGPGAGPPDLNPPNGPVYIGNYSQLYNPPLYYILAAIPIRLSSLPDVAGQLYAARMVSLLLLLVTILSAWGVIAELTPQDHPLRLFVPLTVVLIPGFIDLMTAVNNDVAAVALFSLFLWGAVRMIRRGFSLGTFLWVTAVSILIYWTKETAYFVFPLWGLTLILTLLRGSLRWVAWALLGGAILVGLVAVLSWGDAATWYRSTSQTAPTRLLSSQAVLGKYVFQLDSTAPTTPLWIAPLFQPVPGTAGQDVRGKSYTLGAWMWASQPVKMNMPTLGEGDGQHTQPVELGTEPAFYAMTVKLSGGGYPHLWVALTNPPQKADVNVFYDGLVLVKGSRPLDTPPKFDSPSGDTGVWGGKPFKNLLRNASAESSGPRIKPLMDDLSARYLPDRTRLSLLLTSLLDWSGSGWFLKLSGSRIFRTFWGQFAWGQVSLIGGKPYRNLAIFTIIGLIGALGWVIRKIWEAYRSGAFAEHLQRIPWGVLVLLGFALVGVWGASLTRAMIYLSIPHFYLPVARYVYPAIIPTVLVLSLGWVEVINWLLSWMRRPAAVRFVVYCSVFLGLDVLSVMSIVNFFSRR